MKDSKTTIYGWNFRGFREIRIPLQGMTFLVGDNSSGKSSILHLISCVLSNDLEVLPSLNDELSIGRYDFFSPYFDEADVSLGYEFENTDHRLGKIVTLKKGGQGQPSVIRSSFRVDNTFVSIRKHGSEFRVRISDIEDSVTFDELYALHNKSSGFKNVKNPKKSMPPPNSVMALFRCVSPEIIDERELALCFSMSLPSCRHLSPLRQAPERFYDSVRTISPSGKHFAVMWRDLLSDKTSHLFEKIGKFGAESDLFQEIDVKPITKKVADAPLLVTVKKGGHNFLLNQVGVGVSQVVPVLVESIFAAASERDQMVLFQQPELHLHPVGQAALGTFFADLWKDGLSGVIETHSNFLIDRFRSEMRELSSDASNEAKATVLYTRSTPEGNEISYVEIDGNGKLIDAPKDYFSFFVSEISRTMF